MQVLLWRYCLVLCTGVLDLDQCMVQVYDCLDAAAQSFWSVAEFWSMVALYINRANGAWPGPVAGTCVQWALGRFSVLLLRVLEPVEKRCVQ